jgi:hypothetical protein
VLTSCLQAALVSFSAQLSFHLGQNSQHAEHGFTDGAAGVDLVDIEAADDG